MEKNIGNNMVKKYCLSFLSIDYYAFLMIPTILLFGIMFFYTRNQVDHLRWLIILIALFLFVILFTYNLRKLKIRRTLNSIKNLNEYDEGVFLDRNFLIEKRMLSYSKKQVKEYFYEDLIDVTYQQNKKHELICKFKDGEVILPTGSRAQAERTCAFLLTQNNVIQFHNIEPNGSGTLHSIDNTEVQQ